jgi:hypothetical protein
LEPQGIDPPEAAWQVPRKKCRTSTWLVRSSAAKKVPGPNMFFGKHALLLLSSPHRERFRNTIFFLIKGKPGHWFLVDFFLVRHNLFEKLFAVVLDLPRRETPQNTTKQKGKKSLFL